MQISSNHEKACVAQCGLFQQIQPGPENTHFLCKRAKKYGDQIVSPLQKLARVTVLINREANQRKVADLFEKNALPLLHLAGLAVTVIKVKDKKQMESLVSALDRSEADYVFSVGGDGTLSVVLTAMIKKKLESGEANLPLCAFPGGKENRFLTSMAPEIFGEKEDVRRYCESAMAIIENTRMFVHPVRCNIVNHSEADAVDTSYLLSSLNAGWFEHCEQKKHKLWYWGSLKSKVVYVWEFLKRFPDRFLLPLTMKTVMDATNVMLGTQKKKNDLEPQVDFSKITNPDCGSLKNLNLDATDIRISFLQQRDGSKLNFESGGAKLGRFASMAAGFQRGVSSNKKWLKILQTPSFKPARFSFSSSSSRHSSSTFPFLVIGVNSKTLHRGLLSWNPQMRR
uniref:DAGKc domain-containing protein n=1 Tax=Ditylenchus dipsaci TaxID=166011 RepID=A0A915CU58_9BILA